MTSSAPALRTSASGRFRLLGLLAFLFVAAQLIVAAHADDLADHAPQSCEYCLAAVTSDDPDGLEFRLAPPVNRIESVRQTVNAEILVAIALYSANPRGPPFC